MEDRKRKEGSKGTRRGANEKSFSTQLRGV
jgi:hypothetical protein